MKQFSFLFDEAHNLKTKQYVIDDQGYCVQILDIALTKTGKHGHMKCTIEGRRIETNEKVNLMMAGHSRVIKVEPITETFQVVDWMMTDNDFENVDLTVLDESYKEQHFTVDLSNKRFDSFKHSNHNWRNNDVEVSLCFYPFVTNIDKLDSEDSVERRHYVERLGKSQ